MHNLRAIIEANIDFFTKSIDIETQKRLEVLDLASTLSDENRKTVTSIIEDSMSLHIHNLFYLLEANKTAFSLIKKD
jgi:hypothetical protein